MIDVCAVLLMTMWVKLYIVMEVIGRIGCVFWCRCILLFFGFVVRVCVFLFKQKTAYEMRISDWSSDVCSSDLWGQGGQNGIPGASVSPQVFTWTGDGVTKDIPIPGADVSDSSFYDTAQAEVVLEPGVDFTIVMTDDVSESILRLTTATPNGVTGLSVKIGRATSRERVCHYG